MTQANQPQAGRLQQLLREKLGMPKPQDNETPSMRLAALSQQLAKALDVPVQSVHDSIAARMGAQMQHALDAVAAAKEAALAIVKAQGAHEAALATARLHVASVLGEDFPVA
jgi:hypothetical protein